MTKLQDLLNSGIKDVSRMVRAPKTGDVFGLELECEGARVNWDEVSDITKDWMPHADGSLRNHHGQACEWVFNGPVKYTPAVARVNRLFDYFEMRKAKLVCSNRTSLHIHYNMGDKNVYQLVNLFILFTIFEDILDRYCGDDRKGNLFCLSSRHAEEQVSWLCNAIFKKYSFADFREDWRYCSLNLAAINKFGTVEFRGMRGLDSRAEVLAWLKIVNELCDYACYTMKNPVDVVEAISAKTPSGFLKEVFSKDSLALLTKELSLEEINHSVYEGLRLVQMLCYRVGTEFDQVRLRGRDFWASFKEDAAPDQDVDPAMFVRAPEPAPRRRMAFQAAPPLRGRPGGNGLAEMARQQAELVRQRELDRDRDIFPPVPFPDDVPLPQNEGIREWADQFQVPHRDAAQEAIARIRARNDANRIRPIEMWDQPPVPLHDDEF